MKLIVAEKPSVAQAIAPVVGAVTRKDGYLAGNGYVISWCFGHLCRLIEPDEYCAEWAGKWTFAMLPMIPDTWQYAVSKDKGAAKQFAVLKQLMLDSRITEIICATDADREGESIFRYVYHVAGCQKPVMRLWVSSLEDTAIRAGLAAMKPSSAYDNLFHAGECRDKADWLVGMNGSRLFSVRYPGSMLTIGRVQSPTLAMIVRRDYDAAHFISQRYFTVMLDCGSFSAESERFDDESVAAALVAAVEGQQASVTEITREIRNDKPPKLYDLTSLERAANKLFGLTAKQTDDAMQAIYEAKLATYPRTVSQFLTEDMEQSTRAVISKVHAVFPQLGQSETVDISQCINNQKVAGHHAILPTANIAQADLSKLSDTQRTILMLIASRLILATAAPHRYEYVTATIRCAGTDFKAIGRTVLKSGWRSLESKMKAALQSKDNTENVQPDKALPQLTQGQMIDRVSGEKAEHWTSPPKPYTEDTLLAAMEHAGQDEYDEDSEKKGLGTPATRTKIIEGLIAHGYIERKGKQIRAIEKGVNLISVIPETVKSPKLTAEWEMQLQQIERGAYSAEQFMQGIISYVRNLCAEYGTVDESITFRGSNEPVGNCPHCGKEVRKGQYGYYCTGKCGMNIAKVFGKVLTDFQLMRLLAGKEVTFTAHGIKTIVSPKAVAHTFNGKQVWQWDTRKG